MDQYRLQENKVLKNWWEQYIPPTYLKLKAISFESH